MEEKTIKKVNSPKKIVFLCRDFGKIYRGVESHVEELSKRLAGKYQVKIFSGEDADNLTKILNGKFDLVIPTNGRLQALKVSLARFIGGYKVLIAGHAGIGKDEIWNLLTCPDAYIALTDYELTWAKKFNLVSRLAKIPNGIDLERFKPGQGKIEPELERPVILSVGALEWYKHHDLAIKAVAGLSKGSLLIAGRGSEKNNLENLGRRELGEKRFKIIERDYDEMPIIYNESDLFTLPSWDREAFGIVYLEAMASGLGVVAPDDLSRREIIGNAGIFVDVSNTEKYTQAIEEALKKDWTELSGKQAAKFSWEKITRLYEELIDKILL